MFNKSLYPLNSCSAFSKNCNPVSFWPDSKNVIAIKLQTSHKSFADFMNYY